MEKKAVMEVINICIASIFNSCSLNKAVKSVNTQTFHATCYGSIKTSFGELLSTIGFVQEGMIETSSTVSTEVENNNGGVQVTQ